MENNTRFSLVVRPNGNAGMPALQKMIVLDNLDEALQSFKENAERGDYVRLEVMR